MNLGSAVRLAAAAALFAVGAEAAAQSRPAPRPAPAVPLPPPPSALPASSTSAGAAAQAAALARDARDFDQVAGRWGAAFFGVRSVDFGSFPPGVPNTVEVVTLGVRRWMAPGSMGSSRTWGIDAGLGFGYGRTKTETPVTGGGTSSAQASGFGLGFHLGLPVALAQGRHVTALLAPEVDLLYASGKADQGTPLRIIDWRGFGFDVGARLGAEVYFGFLDMPQLALEGSLGVKVRYDSVTMKPKAVGQSDVSHWRMGSDRPLGFLAGNVAVIYYF